MAVSKLLSAGFGRTGIYGYSRASCSANLPQTASHLEAVRDRKGIHTASNLCRPSVGDPPQEAVVVERVRALRRPSAAYSTSSVGARTVGVSLRQDVGASWPGSKSQSSERAILRRQLASSLCHPSASEASDATFLDKDAASTRDTEPAAVYRLANPSQKATSTSLADVPWKRGRVWLLHSSRVAVAPQEAAVWQHLPASRQLATAPPASASHRNPMADTQVASDQRILDAVPRPHGNPRRTIRPQHHAMPTPHETT